jgi:hypothetical protein
MRHVSPKFGWKPLECHININNNATRVFYNNCFFKNKNKKNNNKKGHGSGYSPPLAFGQKL